MILPGHEPGCWLGNGGATCTCPKFKRTQRFRTDQRNVSNVPQRGDEMMLEKIRNFDPLGGIQLEDAVVLASVARKIAEEYDLLKVDKPAWLVEKTERIRQFVSDSVRDARKKKVAELKARLETLKTASERRADIEKQLADLESAQ